MNSKSAGSRPNKTSLYRQALNVFLWPARENSVAAYLFLIPALVCFALFVVIPLGGAFLLSFTNIDLYTLSESSPTRFIGLANYFSILQSALFWKALGNTVYFVLVGGGLSIFVSLTTALAINSRFIKRTSWITTLYFAPVATSIIAIAIVWRYIYHPRYGVLNFLLGLINVDPIDWLGDPVWAMPAIILMAVWKNFGFNMVIFIAGLRNIPSELYAASRIDGANPWQQFRYITLPMLAPAFWFVGIITMIGYFQLFAEPYIMTQGGPLESTVSVVYLMYEEGFKWWNLGYASAIAFLLFLIVSGVSLIPLLIRKT